MRARSCLVAAIVHRNTPEFLVNSSQRNLSSHLLCLAGVICAQALSGSTVPSVETILTRMAQARAQNRTRLRPYRVTRDYRLFGKEKQSTKSEVIADVTFVPPDLKKYAIRRHVASDGFGVYSQRSVPRPTHDAFARSRV